ncbi:MAG TPA: hypothetical protein VFA09_25150 [Ktedonobacteraceae bacterium]|nr:hypothetical protein [Ktedonobacteraceae bacterium]
MATQCVRCGIVLPRDDARFCSKCGAEQPVRPSSASPSSPDVEGPGLVRSDNDFNSSPSRPSSATSSSRPPADEKDSHSGNRPAIREQIAYRPPSRPSRRPIHNEPPAWINKLEREVAYPIANADPSPARELHVKVWESPEQSKGNAGSPIAQKEASAFEKDAYPVRKEPAISNRSPSNDEVENISTAHLPSVPSDLPPGGRSPASSRIPAGQGQAAVPTESARLDEVEQLDTRPMASQRQAMVQSLPPAAGRFVEQRENRVQEMPRPVQQSMLQRPLSPLPSPQLSHSKDQPAREFQAQRTTPPPSLAMPPRATRSKRKSSKPLVFMFITLGLLLVGGLVAWIVVDSPFTVPAVTNTDQPFQNSTLGFALRYPQGWTAHIDTKKGSVSFYDSSHTGQVIVQETAATGSIAQYIKNEAAQSGMTGQASSPSLAFAGATWQQVKGSIVQDGATYTVILLATEHNNRFYSIMQLAPPAAYSGEEQLVFSHVRASFRFL